MNQSSCRVFSVRLPSLGGDIKAHVPKKSANGSFNAIRLLFVSSFRPSVLSLGLRRGANPPPPRRVPSPALPGPSVSRPASGGESRAQCRGSERGATEPTLANADGFDVLKSREPHLWAGGGDGGRRGRASRETAL